MNLLYLGLLSLKEAPGFAEQIAPIIIDGKQLLACYPAIRDGVVFSNKRIIALNEADSQGQQAQSPISRKLKLHKRRHLFLRSSNEPLSAVTVSISNLDCSPVVIHRQTNS